MSLGVDVCVCDECIALYVSAMQQTEVLNKVFHINFTVHAHINIAGFDSAASMQIEGYAWMQFTRFFMDFTRRRHFLAKITQI